MHRWRRRHGLLRRGPKRWQRQGLRVGGKNGKSGGSTFLDFVFFLLLAVQHFNAIQHLFLDVLVGQQLWLYIHPFSAAKACQAGGSTSLKQESVGFLMMFQVSDWEIIDLFQSLSHRSFRMIDGQRTVRFS